MRIFSVLYTEGAIAKELRRDLRRVKSHLKGLSLLFVLNKINPHPFGTGKPRYYLLDVAFAARLGASHGRLIQTWLLSEQLSQRSCRNDRDSKLFYYRTSKGSVIDLVVEDSKGLHALKINSNENISEADTRILKAFREKSRKKGCSILFGSTRMSNKELGIEVYPWESLV